ncbi:MAG: haloacid dehalogenase type II [Rhizobiales bacterium]|nr:haloacid dehalogenase type II [Hyphomicrobiales bacterium]
MESVKALFFDVFGTVVDWRTSIVRELASFGQMKGIDADWTGFADAWRGLYQPAMEEVRSGRRDWMILDELHRESLVRLLGQFGIGAVSDGEIDDLNRAWHRLDPWPDCVDGLTRLKTKYILSTLSNGNTALLVNMAKRAGLPWDVVLGAETARAYKPLPEAYRRNMALLALKPHQCMMVAAHNDDLKAATALGMRAAFVARPTEYGPGQTRDVAPDEDWDVITDGMTGLATALDC